MDTLTYEQYVEFLAQCIYESPDVDVTDTVYDPLLVRFHKMGLEQSFKFTKDVADRLSELRTNYQYMVTFTVDPKKHPEVPVSKIELYLDSQVDRPALHIQHCSYVQEHHENGRPHWHMKLNTTKPLRSDAFNQYSKAYGNVQISRSKHTNGNHTSIYMNKESVIKVLK